MSLYGWAKVEEVGNVRLHSASCYDKTRGQAVLKDKVEKVTYWTRES